MSRKPLRERILREMFVKDLDKVIGYGWIGRWNDGQIGWGLPDCLSDNLTAVADMGPPGRPHAPGEMVIKCRITVEVVHDKRGREIRKKVK